MQTIDVPFGQWLPSAPDYKNPGCIVANNVIPTTGGYGPLLGPTATEADATGACRGAAQFFGITGDTVIAGGTSTSLFVGNASGLTETAGYVDIGSGQSWHFAQFNDMLIATAPGNVPQYLSDLDSDTSWSALSGSAPIATYCARVSDFLMLGNVAGNEARVQWSPLNSPTGTWGIDRETQAGFLECPRALGAIVGIVGGRFPLIFQERGVSRIEYVGPPRVWMRSEVDQARGCTASGSIVQVGFLTYYLATDGFYVTDGSQFTPLSSGRVTNWFFAEAEPGQLSLTHGAVDWVNECIVWAFQGRTGTGFDRLLIYAWAQDRWASGTVTVGRLVGVKIGGLTLEQIGALYPAIEDVPGSLDDARWRGSSRTLGAFIDDGTDTVLHYFNGASLEADFETGEMQPVPGRRVFMGGARPLIQGASAAQVRSYAVQNDESGAYSAFTTRGVDGVCPLRADGRGLRLALRMPAGAAWSDAQGLQARFRVTGGR